MLVLSLVLHFIEHLNISASNRDQERTVGFVSLWSNPPKSSHEVIVACIVFSVAMRLHKGRTFAANIMSSSQLLYTTRAKYIVGTALPQARPKAAV